MSAEGAPYLLTAQRLGLWRLLPTGVKRGERRMEVRKGFLESRCGFESRPLT